MLHEGDKKILENVAKVIAVLMFTASYIAGAHSNAGI